MSNKMKAEELMEMMKVGDFFRKQKEEEERKKQSNTVLWILAIVGVIAAIVGIAYALYLYFTPDYLEDFEEDFDDDFDDDYFEEDDEDDLVEVEPAVELDEVEVDEITE